MKTYRGTAGLVTIEDDDGVRTMGTFEWGKPSVGAAALAMAILLDLLRDRSRAEKLYRRFMHRTVVNWTYGRPWSLSESEAKTVVEAIEHVEVEARGLVRQMDRERPSQILTDTAPPGGEWTQQPNIEPNIKKKNP